MTWIKIKDQLVNLSTISIIYNDAVNITKIKPCVVFCYGDQIHRIHCDSEEELAAILKQIAAIVGA